MEAVPAGPLMRTPSSTVSSTSKRMFTRLLDGPRVVRDEGGVTILRMDDVLAVTKRRDVHSMDPSMIEFATAYMGAGRPLIPLMLDGDAAHQVPQAARPAVRAEGRSPRSSRASAHSPTS